MEDSSQNPYIPQESEAIRQKVYERQSPLGRVVKWSLIVTVVVAILVAVGLFFVVPRTTANDQQARIKLANTLQPPEQVLKRVNVASDTGFKLNYDNHIYSSYAEVNSTPESKAAAGTGAGETYENNDLRVARAYDYVRIRPIESVDSARALAPLPPELEIFATMSSEDLAKAAAVPENKGLSKLSLFVKIDGDKRAAKKIADDKTVVTIDATKPVSASIGGVDYQRVRYTTTNDNHRVSNVKYDECYYTIQNDQPYSICVSGVRPTNVSAASLVEEVFDSITYEQPAESSSTTERKDSSAQTTSLISPSIRLAQATKDSADSTPTDTNSNADANTSESPLLTITPPYYSDADSLMSIAKAQPSVVRIGTLYCADLSLKLESGDTATTLTDACVGNMATGVFVSKDGYIATTGHAIREQKKAAISGYINFATDQDQMLDRLQRVLDYLLKAKIILQSDAEYLKTGASIGDQEALAKVQNLGSVIPDNFITPLNESYTYALQPTDKPIVVNRTDTAKPSFAYSDSVISAKYVASNYDASKSVQEVFGSQTPSADVGLLKVDGDYPEVTIAQNEDVKANDMLSTIGYPAYADSSLTIDKLRNLPVVTSSKVEQAYQKDGGRLIQTNTPVLPGNDGAPVFDNSGRLIGFAVYGLSYCPDQQCFANGTVRSSTELLKLLDDNNIKLSTGSQMSADWNEGVTQYFHANYAASTSAFALAASDYPFNRWADPLSKLAAAAQGSPSDTSFMNQLQLIMIVVLVILVVLTIVLTILFLLHRRRISQLRVGHYGADDGTASVPPAPMTLPDVSVAPAPSYAPPASQPPVSQPTRIPVQQPQMPSLPSQNAQPQSPPQTLPGGPATPVQPPSSEDPFYK